MDNVTHSLVAITLGRTAAARRIPGAAAALLLSSNAPDADIVAAFTGGPEAYLAAHRGMTHGPIGIGALAAAVAALVWLGLRALRRGESRAAPVSVGGLCLVALVGTALHVTMDFPTSYGTRLLSPFSDRWFAVDWVPIIDIYLLSALVAGLAALTWSGSRRSRVLATVLAVIIGHYGVRATAHALAVRQASERPATTTIESWRGDAAPDKLRPSADIIAVPTFLSPLQWRILRGSTDGYELTEIDLLGRWPPAGPVWYPIDRGPLVERAMAAPSAQVFLAFARAPSARVLPEPGGGAIVRFRDLRFMRSRLEPGVEAPPSGPFVVRVRLDPSGKVADSAFE